MQAYSCPNATRTVWTARGAKCVTCPEGMRASETYGAIVCLPQTPFFCSTYKASLCVNEDPNTRGVSRICWESLYGHYSSEPSLEPGVSTACECVEDEVANANDTVCSTCKKAIGIPCADMPAAGVFFCDSIHAGACHAEDTKTNGTSQACFDRLLAHYGSSQARLEPGVEAQCSCVDGEAWNGSLTVCAGCKRAIGIPCKRKETYPTQQLTVGNGCTLRGVAVNGVVQCTLSDGSRSECLSINTSAIPDHPIGPWCDGGNWNNTVRRGC